MAKVSNPPLQPNPFITYRDPQTGLWIVGKTTPVSDNLPEIPPKESDAGKIKEEQESSCCVS